MEWGVYSIWDVLDNVKVESVKFCGLWKLYLSWLFFGVWESLEVVLDFIVEMKELYLFYREMSYCFGVIIYWIKVLKINMILYNSLCLYIEFL